VRALTPTQIRVVEEYVRTGSMKEAAAALGISVQTVKNHLSTVYRRLETQGILQTLDVLGWISGPGSPPRRRRCGHMAVCTLDELHPGDHGRYRDVGVKG
jgi:DNA-binding CsgD family transcriptional regulator